MNIEIRFELLNLGKGVLKIGGKRNADLTPLFDKFNDECDYNKLAKDCHLPDGYEITNAELVLLDGRKIIKRKPLKNNASNTEKAN